MKGKWHDAQAPRRRPPRSARRDGASCASPTASKRPRRPPPRGAGQCASPHRRRAPHALGRQADVGRRRRLRVARRREPFVRLPAMPRPSASACCSRAPDGELTLIETETLDAPPSDRSHGRLRPPASPSTRCVRAPIAAGVAARAAGRRRRPRPRASPARTSEDRPRAGRLPRVSQAGRVLIFGESEIRYLESLDAATRAGTHRRASCAQTFPAS